MQVEAMEVGAESDNETPSVGWDAQNTESVSTDEHNVGAVALDE